MITRILCCLVLFLPLVGEAGQFASPEAVEPLEGPTEEAEGATSEFLEFCKNNLQDLPPEEADLRLECLFSLVDHYATVGDLDNWKNLYGGYLNVLFYSGQLETYWATSFAYCTELYLSFGLAGESISCLEDLYNTEQVTEQTRRQARSTLCGLSAFENIPSKDAEAACKDLRHSYSQDPASLQPDEFLSIALNSLNAGDYAGIVALTECLPDSCGMKLSGAEGLNALDFRARGQVGLGRIEDADLTLQEAVNAARQLEDPVAKKLTLSSLLMQRGNLLRLLGLYSDALDCLQQALTIAKQQPDVEELIYAQYVQTYLLAGRPNDAEEKLESFRAVEGNLPPKLKTVAINLWKGHIAYLRRDLSAARESLSRVEGQLTLLKDYQLPPDHSQWIESMLDTVADFEVLLASELPDKTEAIRLQELMVVRFERRKDLHSETSARIALARLLSAAGDVERAEQEYLAALQLAVSSGQVDLEVGTRSELSIFYTLQAKFQKGERQALLALQVAEESGAEEFILTALAAYGGALAWQEKFPALREVAQRGESLLPEIASCSLGFSFLELGCWSDYYSWDVPTSQKQGECQAWLDEVKACGFHDSLPRAAAAVAGLHVDSGDKGQGIVLIDQVFEGRRHELTPEDVVREVWVRVAAGDLEKAERILSDLKEGVLGPITSNQRITASLELARLYNMELRSEDALAVYVEIEASSADLGPETKAQILWARALASRRDGDVSGYFRLASDAVKLLETADLPWFVAWIQEQVADQYGYLRRAEDAARAWRAAEVAWDQVQDPVMALRSLRCKGFALLAEGKTNDATDVFLQFLQQLSEAELAKEMTLTMLMPVLNLVLEASPEGLKDVAAQAEELEVSVETMSSPWNRVQSAVPLADLHLQLDNPGRALDLLQSIETDLEGVQDEGLKLRALRILAASHAQEGRPEEAIKLVEEAARIADRQIWLLETNSSPLDSYYPLLTFYSKVVALLGDLVDDSMDPKLRDLLLELIEKQKLLEYLLSVPSTDSNLDAKLPSSMMEQLASLREDVWFLKAELDRARSQPPDESRQSRKAILETLLREKQSAFLRATQEASKAVSPDRSGVAPELLRRLTSAVGDDAAILAFYPVGNRLFSFVISQRGGVARTADIPKVQLEEETAHFLSLLENKDRTPEEAAELHASSARLFEWLVEPVASELEPFRHIAVTGSGLVRYLPFAALDVNEQRLEDLKSFSYLTISSMFTSSLSDEMPAEESIQYLAFANPDGTLPASEAEVESSKKWFSQHQIYQGAEATKAQFLSSAPRSSTIHLATHAYLNNLQPDKSYIQFAGSSLSDQQLQAAEIGLIDLNGSDLVVLSACETAKTSATADFGVFGIDGLAYEFERAGSASVVATLWRVRDEAAKAFTENFFFNLQQEELPKDTALARAQLSMIEEGWDFADWAAFVLIGNPR